MAKRTLRDRILSKVQVDPESGCWIWTAAKNPHGYGVINVGGKTQKAHRVAYQEFIGPIPDESELDHLCRRRPCVNPEHLDPVDHQTNMSRGHFGSLTHCPAGHEYAGDNLYLPPSGGRECRICRSQNFRAWNETRKADRPEREAKSHCPQGHEYAGDNLYVSPRGDRNCRTCVRAQVRAYRERKKAEVPR